MTSISPVHKAVYVCVVDGVYHELKTELICDVICRPMPDSYVLKFTHENFINTMKTIGSKLKITHKEFYVTEVLSYAGDEIKAVTWFQTTYDNIICSGNFVLCELYLDTYQEHLSTYVTDGLFSRYIYPVLLDIGPALFAIFVKHVETRKDATNVLTYITDHNENDSRFEYYILSHKYFLEKKLEPYAPYLSIYTSKRNIKTIKYIIDYINVNTFWPYFIDAIQQNKPDIADVFKSKCVGSYTISAKDVPKSMTYDTAIYFTRHYLDKIIILDDTCIWLLLYNHSNQKDEVFNYLANVFPNHLDYKDRVNLEQTGP